MAPESMDSVFAALGHADRRRILDILKSRPGCSVNDVCAYFQTSRIAVMKHLRVLQAANLVHSGKKGRVRMLYFNSVPIQMIYDRWTTQYSALWARRLMDIKYKVESAKRPAAKSRKRRVNTSNRRTESSKPPTVGLRRKQKGN